MSIDRSIREFTSIGLPMHAWLVDTPAIGIELEYENSQLSRWPQDIHRWSVSGDGSLRTGGVELISHPLALEDVDAALTEAEHAVGRINAVATERCGLHTHMNMRPYSVGQVWSLATLYALVEPTLYQTYAIGRENSVFGVPMWMNRHVVQSLFRDITSIRGKSTILAVPGHCFTSRTSKYSALNFSCLSTLGTVEMRQPYCTTDFEAIRSWLGFNLRLYEQGVAHDDPLEILEQYERDGLSALQRELFGDVFNVDPDIQEQADDAAYYIAGFIEPQWEELNWNDLMEVA